MLTLLYGTLLFSHLRWAFLFCVTLLICSPVLVYCQSENSCAEFNALISSTYNFRPALLASQEEREQKSAGMDRVWNEVKARREALLPCLRKALEDPRADRWFLFDGSNLLISLDSSADSKKLVIKSYAATNLDDVDFQTWVGTLARLGAEGFDTSIPGERWLAHPNAVYVLPLHGAAKVDKLLGGMFIFGSMDEAQATPALLKIANSAAHAGREEAISLLLMQATPEAISGLKQIDQSALSATAASTLKQHLSHPILIEPRKKPKNTREEFLNAFNDAVKGNWQSFLRLATTVSDGEKDVVATLQPQDIPLLRIVRRSMIAKANPHVAEYYVSFTQILMTMIWRPEMAKQ